MSNISTYLQMIPAFYSCHGAVRMPIMTQSFCMLMDGKWKFILSGQFIDFIQELWVRFTNQKLQTQFLTLLKELFPFFYRFSIGIHRNHLNLVAIQYSLHFRNLFIRQSGNYLPSELIT